MTDLISRTAALEALRQISARPSSIDAIEALPAITPKVVAAAQYAVEELSLWGDDSLEAFNLTGVLEKLTDTLGENP